MDWSIEWTENLDTEVYEPYPLQFANVERIECNDAVYMFDETGSGKTISSGLMVLHYLYNHPQEKALVITENALVKEDKKHSDLKTKDAYGQFLSDWYYKLPFDGDLKNRIEIINNDYRNVQNAECEYGILVVDEAHRFLEAEKRKTALKNIRAHKIIFMTATPIKRGAYNLEDYCDLADAILGKKVDRSWVNDIEDCNDTLCDSFDPQKPVTRYFKDTVTALDYVENGKIEFEKKKAIRRLPAVWEYDDGNQRPVTLANKVLENRYYDENGIKKKNRFVVFTRFIGKEEDKITEYFSNHGEFFHEYEETYSGDKMTYICINGQSERSVSEYTHNGTKKPLPDIMIVTYQLAEAGVNLPGFNYVINYHVSAFPSSLEQRFGRIDRMGKDGTQFQEIHMVYMLSSRYDRNTANFGIAYWLFNSQIIPYLPSKNVLITSALYKAHFKGKSDLLKKELSVIENELKNPNFIASLYSKLLNGEENEVLDLLDLDEDLPEIDKELPWDEQLDVFNEKVLYKIKLIQDAIKTIEKEGENVDNIQNIGDNISWKDSLLDAIQDCAVNIDKQSEYKEYCEAFNKLIKLPIEISKIRNGIADSLESYFEKQFLTTLEEKHGVQCIEEYNDFHVGQFENIFTENYWQLLSGVEDFSAEYVLPDEKWIHIQKRLPSTGQEPMGKDEFLKRCYDNNWVKKLPFFNMCDSFGETLYNYCFCKKSPYGNTDYIDYSGEYLKDVFRDNPFWYTFYLLKRNGLIPNDILARSNHHDFETVIFDKPGKRWGDETFCECSSWLKLVFLKMKELKELDTFWSMVYTNDGHLREVIREYNSKTWHALSWTRLLPYYSSGRGYRNYTQTEYKKEGIKAADQLTSDIMELLLPDKYEWGVYTAYPPYGY